MTENFFVNFRVKLGSIPAHTDKFENIKFISIVPRFARNLELIVSRRCIQEIHLHLVGHDPVFAVSLYLKLRRR